MLPEATTSPRRTQRDTNRSETGARFAAAANVTYGLLRTCSRMDRGTDAVSHTSLPSATDLNRLLAGAQLPALPQTAIRVLELARDPDNGPAEFAMPIESEPGISSQVLRFVNSSYFGFSQEIASIKLAITLVGIRTIKNFVLWSAVYNMMPNPKCGDLDLKKLWQDSLRRGLLARAVLLLSGKRDTEEAFAAALLQDMAVPLLAKELPTEYGEMLAQRAEAACRLSDLERERFGWTHADAGNLVASKWNLPPSFVALVQRHIQLDALLEQEKVPPELPAVALSAMLPASVDNQWSEAAVFENAYQRINPSGTPTTRQLLADVDGQFAEFAPLLQLSSSTRPLVAYYDEARDIVV